MKSLMQIFWSQSWSYQNLNFFQRENVDSNFNDDELKERINCYDDNDGLYEELVDNVISNPTPVINNQGGQS